MPKEYITTASSRERADRLGGDREAVRVGWGREGWVQIASVLMQQIEGSTSPTEARVDQGQFVDLDRESVNNLIRVLRRARDQAFGKDE